MRLRYLLYLVIILLAGCVSTTDVVIIEDVTVILVIEDNTL